MIPNIKARNVQVAAFEANSMALLQAVMQTWFLNAGEFVILDIQHSAASTYYGAAVVNVFSALLSYTK
jgi:hypothetical protein